MATKKWSIIFLVSICTLIFFAGLVTVIIDPYFHYHKPLKCLSYPLYNERYQNDGIVKNFEYDAIITGTSMTQNFKTSEADRIFDVNSIKVAYSGASFKEINDNLERAIKANEEIKLIIRGLDYEKIFDNSDKMNYEGYPTYLYDYNVLNDVNYVLNKEILLGATKRVILYTLNENEGTSFDEYSNWMADEVFGKEAVLKTYTRPQKSNASNNLSAEEEKVIRENINENIIGLVKNNPDIEFRLFFTPYSVYWFDRENQNGNLQKWFEAEKIVIEMLLKHENVKLYSFFNNYDLICNPDNYVDIYHYGEHINSQILIWMFNDSYRITNDNYERYCKEVKDYYLNYNYDLLH